LILEDGHFLGKRKKKKAFFLHKKILKLIKMKFVLTNVGATIRLCDELWLVEGCFYMDSL